MADRAQLLQQADIVLSRCGRPMAPAGSAYIDLPSVYLYQTLINANGTPQSEPRVVVGGDTNFILRAISGFNQIVSPLSWPNYFYRIKFPDGSYFQGSWSASVGDWAFARGSYRMVIDGEVICPPGSEIMVDLNPGTAPTAAGNPQILFEGVHRYLISGVTPQVQPSLVPRYIRDCNQNIMCPEWMTGAPCLETPPGWVDEYFAYVSPVMTIPITAGAATPQLQQDFSGMPGSYDFVWRETRWVILFTGSAAGTPVVKITLPDGFALTDDWCQCTEIAGPTPKDIIVPRKRSVLVDATLFDATGTGTCTIQAYLKGARRKAA